MPRLFIALPIGESVSANLERAGKGWTAGGVRWLRAENMHLTLAFLGEVEERRFDELESAVLAATEGVASPVHLRARSLGAFPNEERARVVWAGVYGEVPKLIELHERLVTELRRATFEVDSKRFRPHITLARLRWPQRLPDRLPRLQEFGEWQATELQLIESHLHPSGARYVVRADVQLE